jgi:hypothetical protein
MRDLYFKMFNPRYTSFLIIFNVLYSFSSSFSFLALLETCVLITSLIHHNKLIPNFRKYDLTFTYSIIVYHIYLYSYLITREYYTWLPCLFYVLGIGSYILSASSDAYKTNIDPMSLYHDKYHGYYHIFGLIGNLILIYCLKNNREWI